MTADNLSSFVDFVIMYVWIVLCVFYLYVYVYVCACMDVPPMRKSGCADH